MWFERVKRENMTLSLSQCISFPYDIFLFLCDHENINHYVYTTPSTYTNLKTQVPRESYFSVSDGEANHQSQGGQTSDLRQGLLRKQASYVGR